jgi:CRISPR system Cascade subunit CasD
MRSVLLRLEGPLQAWSSQSKLGVRDTDREPSKSGVLGLAAAALGVDRKDDETLAELVTLTMAVRVDRPGSLLRDYHTTGGGRFRGSEYFAFDVKDCIPSERYYLNNASFVAALAGDGPWVDRIASALKAPRWPLFLGRRACVPSVPILMGVVDGDAPTAVREAPLAEGVPPEVPLRLMVEAHPEEGGELRYDVPVSFAQGARRYTARYVRTEWTSAQGVEAQS